MPTKTGLFDVARAEMTDLRGDHVGDHDVPIPLRDNQQILSSRRICHMDLLHFDL
jgi:hypothetical protein